MYAFPSLSITSSTPFVFAPFGVRSAKRITYLEVQVLTGSADVYVGPWPDVPIVAQSIDFDQIDIATTGRSVDASTWTSEADSGRMGRHLNVKPGWVVTSASVGANVDKYVTQIDGDILTFNDTLAAGTGQTMTLQAPLFADFTNGIVLPDGAFRVWTAPSNGSLLSGAVKFAVSSGTGLINIQYDYA